MLNRQNVLRIPVIIMLSIAALLAVKQVAKWVENSAVERNIRLEQMARAQREWLAAENDRTTKAEAERLAKVIERQRIGDHELPALTQRIRTLLVNGPSGTDGFDVTFDAASETLEIRVAITKDFWIAMGGRDRLVCLLAQEATASGVPWSKLLTIVERLERTATKDTFGNIKSETKWTPKFSGEWDRETTKKIQWSTFEQWNIWRLAKRRFVDSDAMTWDDAGAAWDWSQERIDWTGK